MFGIEHTINPLNIFYYDIFEDWFNTEFSKNRLGDLSDLTLHPCAGNIGLDKIPEKLKFNVLEKYGKTRVSSLLLNINSFNAPTSLIKHMDMLDSQRNTNWRNTFKEVSEYF
jgi:hypothetical protein